MKRFIDLRKSHTGYNFAWFDTIIDKFEEFWDAQAWDTWEEFEQHYNGNEIERYEALVPEWVWDLPT